MDAYIVPTADFHESEYVGDHFKCRQYLDRILPVQREFAVVTIRKSKVSLGRWKISSRQQISWTSEKMMKMGQEGVPLVLAGYLEAAEVRGKMAVWDLIGRVVNALA